MLDLYDVQGNIVRGYSSFGQARFLYFRLSQNVSAACDGIRGLRPLVVAAKWREKPQWALNVAISFSGLKRLGLPADSLASFPGAFQAGMASRAVILGDTGDSAPCRWEEPWSNGSVDLLVTIYAGDVTEVNQGEKAALVALGSAGRLLSRQDCAVLLHGKGGRREHFGFRDGLTNPEIDGALPEKSGNRSRLADQPGNAKPIAAGEFILGQPDEGGELGILPVPRLLVRNGTYLVVRKLEQDVAGFDDFVGEQARTYPGLVPDPEYLAAKMVGRWKDGTPLTLYPNNPGSAGNPTNDFGYLDDVEGANCPIGAHIRRSNPRDSLGFDGVIVNRHRLIRRGIPYGTREKGGLMFLAFNASIERQFEFIQQQWINYGDAFGQGNDKDALVGAKDAPAEITKGNGRMIIPGDRRTGRRPFVCAGIPRFVTMRGGEYFFVPSLTALDLIGAGKVRTSQ